MPNVSAPTASLGSPSGAETFVRTRIEPGAELGPGNVFPAAYGENAD